MKNNSEIKKLTELGKLSKNQKDYDSAIHYYSKALYLSPDDINLNTELAELYVLKAENEKENFYKNRYYQLAMEQFRKVLKTDPSDQNIHKTLIMCAQKTNTLDELAVEYREKIKRTTDQSIKEIYEDCLKKIHAMTFLDKNLSITKVKKSYYEPSLPIKIIFDFLFLPLSLFLYILSLFDNRFKNIFMPSIILLTFYIAYRIVLILAKK